MTGSSAIEALQIGAYHHLLNPENLGQKRSSIYFGKPFRVIVRFVYGIICFTIIPIIKLFWYILKGIDLLIIKKSKENEEAVKKEAIYYFKTALIDILTATLVITHGYMAHHFFLIAHGHVGALLVATISTICFIAGPIIFAISPDTFKDLTFSKVIHKLEQTFP